MQPKSFCHIYGQLGVRVPVFVIAMMLAITGSAVTAPDDWFITSTGGSGGQFGKGDSRNALLDVSFLNANTGVAVGHSGAFRTDDGGLTWNALPIPMIPNREGTDKAHGWYGVRMVSKDEIWALGHYHPGGIGQTLDPLGKPQKQIFLFLCPQSDQHGVE